MTHLLHANDFVSEWSMGRDAYRQNISPRGRKKKVIKPQSGRKKFGEQLHQSQSSLNQVAHHRETLRTANCTKEVETPT